MEWLFCCWCYLLAEACEVEWRDVNPGQLGGGKREEGTTGAGLFLVLELDAVFWLRMR